ncbi:MAG: sugar ABC transporter permease [Clostridia bacterium]|nr:sugar ABC transporter permease [Clostridia bacterium]
MATKAPKNPHDKHRLTKRRVREWFYGYLFISPWIVGVSIFFVYAMVRSLIFSFSDVQIGGEAGLTIVPLQNIFQNYINVFTTEVNFPITLGSFAISLVLQLPIIISFSLIIALLLNSKIRARGIFRMIFFLPVIIATGPVMNMLTAQGVASVPMMNDGSLAAIFAGLPQFLLDPLTELFNSLIIILWNAGIQILIFLSGLQKVSKTLYEAAKIDGASGWESFWKITLPIVKPMILLNAIYTVVTLATGGTNEIIELIYTVTNAPTKGYEYGMAMSWIYTLIIGVILLIVFLLFREKSDKKVKYEKKLVTLR